MNIKDLVEELKDCTSYQNFIKENKDSYFSAGFLILDLVESTEKIQLDFFIPSKKNVASFEFPFTLLKEPKIHEDKIESMTPQTTELKADIDDLIPMCKEVIFENQCSLKPTKIIAIIRDNQWNLTCMDNVLGIVRIKIDALTAKVISFEKGSLMDFMGIKKG